MTDEEFNQKVKAYLKDNLKIVIDIRTDYYDNADVTVVVALGDEKVSESCDTIYAPSPCSCSCGG